MTRLLFVAAPLTARSGVYRSARELVEAGRAMGLPWSLVLGVAGSARGARPEHDPPWIEEVRMDPAGLRGVGRIVQLLNGSSAATSADLVVSLLPQTDMALATTRLPWVSWLRGMPWPLRGEVPATRRIVWHVLERLALRRARARWVTTEALADESRLPGLRLVPPGIRPVPRIENGESDKRRVVWAARFDTDKNPDLFLRILEGQQLDGLMYGSGPLETSVREAAPANVRVAGWVPAEDLFVDALAYVGTSTREAFGRSAVEAAMSGIPPIVEERFGAAPMLYTDLALRRRFVLPADEPERWRMALEDLSRNRDLRKAVSDHVHGNAVRLSVRSSAEQVVAATADLVGTTRS